MTLTADLVEPHVGSEVTVHLNDDTTFALTLTKVIASAVPEDAEEGALVQAGGFSMTLRGPHSPVLPNVTYPVTFPGMEPVHLFINPHFQDADKTLYNIVVN
ncbi:hypothetical protein [uncultured Tateyamaria sp.]|uniref:DUF6916 family protein n=1 Tax=uncultured Tateyamaria sp. TaxID=455651 RepID=UPI00261EC616|nr:hypothetical protein [uncultured Tateyamaria sp.]